VTRGAPRGGRGKKKREKKRERERERYIISDVDLCLDKYLGAKNEERFRNEISIHYEAAQSHICTAACSQSGEIENNSLSHRNKVNY